jgi:hypothetical protein
MEEIRDFANDIWLVDGPIVRDMGVLFTTRMTIVKLSNGSIWISSPVSVSFDTLKRISELGDVRYLIAATPRHVWRLATWHTLFPEAQLWASRPTLFTLQNGHLPITGYLGDSPVKVWSADFDQLEFKGNPFLSEVLFFHRNSHTVILDDLIQRNPPAQRNALANAILKLEGAQDPDGVVGLDMKMTFLNRSLARQSLQKLLSWDFDKLIIAHGACFESDAKHYVRRAFRWLER